MSLRRRSGRLVEPVSYAQPADQPAVRDGPGDSVTGQILRFIEARHLAPGDRLPSERELAQRLNVSRPALRESLAALEAMRVIARRPNSGIYLAAPGSHPSFESVVLRSDLGLALGAARGLLPHDRRFRTGGLPWAPGLARTRRVAGQRMRARVSGSTIAAHAWRVSASKACCVALSCRQRGRGTTRNESGVPPPVTAHVPARLVARR